MLGPQGENDMVSVGSIAQYEDGCVNILVEWVGFGPDKRTWEPLDRIHGSAPEFVQSELRRLCLARVVGTRPV